MAPATHDDVEIPLDEFIPQADLAALCQRGAAHRAGGLLSLRDGRHFLLREAVRVLGRAGGEGTDPFGFVGLVDTVRGLIDRGFVVGAAHIALGRRVYDVEHGWLAEPLASADSSGINPRIG